MENIQIIILVAIIIVAILQILLLLKKSGKFNTDDILSPMSQSFERIERFTSNELGKNREESSQQSRFNREELGGTVKAELLTKLFKNVFDVILLVALVELETCAIIESIFEVIISCNPLFLIKILIHYKKIQLLF